MKKLILIIIILFIPILNVNASMDDTCAISETSLAVDGNIIGYYECDDTGDSVGSYNLTNVNSVAFSVCGFGNCCDFGDPNTNKVLYNDDTGLDQADDRTYMYWIKYYSAIDYGANFTHMYGEAVGTYYGALWWSDDMTYYSNSNIVTTLTDDTDWHHIAITASGNDRYAYLDGDYIDTDVEFTGNYLTDPDDRIVLGGLWDLSTAYNGYIDDFVYFDRKLTTQEISDYYSGELCPEPVSTSTPSIANIPYNMPFINDLALVSKKVETWNHDHDTLRGEKFAYIYIPFFVVAFLALIVYYIGKRLILELIIRVRK